MLAAMRRAFVAVGGPSMCFPDFVILGDPILRDGFLRHSKIELLIADHFADQVLQSILGLGIPRRFDGAARLRPKIGRVIGAAKASWNEVIDLVVWVCSWRQSVAF
jgi:hypothetical protein